jgi:hypothetical protein
MYGSPRQWDEKILMYDSNHLNKYSDLRLMFIQILLFELVAALNGGKSVFIKMQILLPNGKKYFEFKFKSCKSCLIGLCNIVHDIIFFLSVLGW